jgi:uncharacterized protein
VIFVDTNVLMYAVGREHPLRREAQGFFQGAMKGGRNELCTSVEVLQELLHAYLPVNRVRTLDAALSLARSCIPVVFPIDVADVRAARGLSDTNPQLGARDLLHLAVCRRHSVGDVRTYDRALLAAFQR